LNTILDASTFINLSNGAVLEQVVRLKARKFWIGPIVRGECHRNEPTIDALSSASLLGLLDDDVVPASAFLMLLGEYRLGDGETECLAIAIRGDYDVACDDAAARRVLASHLGPERVCGSLRLMKDACGEGLLRADEAYASYEQMKTLGGFLPELAKDFFTV
jgi:predicted nucleic acid-binding protein